MPIFYDIVKDCKSILDPFAGTGKIGLLKDLGFKGKIICNDLEAEYSEIKYYSVDEWLHQDAEFIHCEKVDTIVTSPTYGNRMADSHNARDLSKRMTYKHQLGRDLTNGNTGVMQWGEKYKQKHIACYNHWRSLLNKDGLLVINISDHIRKGQIVNVAEWHKQTLISLGYKFVSETKVPVSRLRFGANNKLRIDYEYIFVFNSPLTL